MPEKNHFALLWTAVAGGFCAGGLGLETREINPAGWALFLVGLCASMAGAFGLAFPRFRAALSGRPRPGLGLVVPGLALVFIVSPLDFQFGPLTLPRVEWMVDLGLVLAGSGLLVYFWGRRLLAGWRASHPRLGRLPASAGMVLVALGICLGYSSLVGLMALLLLVLPGLIISQK